MATKCGDTVALRLLGDGQLCSGSGVFGLVGQSGLILCYSLCKVLGGHGDVASTHGLVVVGFQLSSHLGKDTVNFLDLCSGNGVAGIKSHNLLVFHLSVCIFFLIKQRISSIKHALNSGLTFGLGSGKSSLTCGFLFGGYTSSLSLGSQTSSFLFGSYTSGFFSGQTSSFSFGSNPCSLLLCSDTGSFSLRS